MPMLPKGRTSRKLALGFGLLILIIAITALITLVQIRQIDRNVKNIVDNEAPIEQVVLEMENNINKTAISLYNYLGDMDSINERDLIDSDNAFEATTDKFTLMARTSEMKQAGSKITLLNEEFRTLAEETMSLVYQHKVALDTFKEGVGELDDLMRETFQTAIDPNSPEDMRKWEAALGMKTAMDETFNAIESYLTEADPVIRQQALDSQSLFKLSVNAFRGNSLTTYEESWLNNISAKFLAIVDDGNALISNTTNLNILISRFQQVLNELTDYIALDVQPLAHRQVTQAIISAKSSTETATVWLITLSALGILIGGLFAWITSRGIIKGLKETLRGIEKVGSGKLTHRLNVDAKGEFGQLALAFNTMLNDLGRSSDILQRNEEMAWMLLNAPSDSAVLIDKRGIILASNKLAAKMYDKKEEEMTGQRLYDLLPTEIMISRKLQVAEVINKGKPLHFEEEYGGMILDQRMYPVPGITGKLSRIAIFTSDITVRKLVDGVVEGLSQRNELLLQAAGDGIYGVDRQGRTIFVNPAAAQMLGYEQDELIGKNLHEIVHHSKPDGTTYPPEECPIYAAFKDGTVHIGDEEVFWRKDGTSFPVAYTSKPMIDNGQIVGTVVTYQDITERKLLEETLRESERKYRSIFDSVANIILSVDIEGNIADCNNRIEMILGYMPDEVIGKPLLNIIHPDYSPKFRESLENVIKNGFEYDSVFMMMQKNGTPIKVNVDAVVMKNDKGEYMRTVCMIDDVTEPAQI